MNSESSRIAGQLRAAFAGDPWHGDPIDKLLGGITAEQAYAHPLANAHSIWELVLHIELYMRLANEAVQGMPMPRLYGTGGDWTTVAVHWDAAWADAKRSLLNTAERLAVSVGGFKDARLHDTVPGRDYDFYYLFHGIVQHSLYHAGQIAMLKRIG